MEMTKRWHTKNVISWGKARSSDPLTFQMSEKEPEIINSKLTVFPQKFILKFIDNWQGRLTFSGIR
jgi:hypothetical protein